MMIEMTTNHWWDHHHPNVFQSFVTIGAAVEVPEYYQNFLQHQAILGSMNNDVNLNLVWCKNLIKRKHGE